MTSVGLIIRQNRLKAKLLQIKNYVVKCLILNVVYILSYPTIEIVKQLKKSLRQEP